MYNAQKETNMTGGGLILPDDSDELITSDDAEIVDVGSMIGGILHALGEMEQRVELLFEKQMELENKIELLEEAISESDD